MHFGLSNNVAVSRLSRLRYISPAKMKKAVSHIVAFAIKVIVKLGDVLLAVFTLGYRPYSKNLESVNNQNVRDLIGLRIEVGKLTSSVEEYKSSEKALRLDVEEFEEATRSLSRDKEKLESELAKYKTPTVVEITEVVKDLKPIIPHYQRQDEDPTEIPGLFRRAGNIHSVRYNNCATYAQLFQAAFAYAFDDLVQTSQPFNPRGITLFNRSRRLNEEIESGNFKRFDSIVNKAVLDLLQGAELTFNGCQGRKVVFNNKGLSVASSKPEYVVSLNDKGQCNVKIHYNHVDVLTPKETDFNEKGIDPEGAKLLLHRLQDNPQALRTLETLLLSDIINDSNPELKAARQFLNEANEVSVLVSSLFQMVQEISVSVKQKFFFEEMVLKDLIMQKACEHIDIPLIQKSSDQSQVKQSPPSGRATPVLEKSANSGYKTWAPGVPLEKLAIQQDFATMQSALERLAKDVTPEMYIGELPNKLPDFPSLTYEQLSKAFFIAHPRMKEHDCLISALTTFFTTKPSEITALKGNQIKSAMYLYFKKHKQKYAPIIQEQLQMNAEEYSKWLHGSGNRKNALDLCDVDIDVFAHTFGVQVVVFNPGMQTQKLSDGSFAPKGSSYTIGPKTKEKLYLFLHPNFTYYAMMPRLDSEMMLNTNPALYDTWHDIERYWQSLDEDVRRFMVIDNND